ncbi:MAG: hypothetical protein Q8J72_10495 [Rhodocyclaceae bacterium]|jgi:hypothetical protein|nr:hypothetical protein [Rhodocyclaceae bacterium]MDP2196398.1 hypothetical protein [Rhodocyclaceae bacterium]
MQKHVARLACAGQPNLAGDAFDPRRSRDLQGTIVLQRNCLGLRRNFAAARFHGRLLFNVLPV